MSPSVPEAIRVGVVGAQGRMGRFACRLIEEEASRRGLALVARVGPADDLEAVLTGQRVDVALDVTRAGRGFEHGARMLAIGVRPLIGTSGVDAAATRELDHLAREAQLGGLVVPNFSLGAWLQQKLVLEAARHFPALEIIEEHHAEKRDAPSGTALDLVERLGQAGLASDTPIHSLRLPGILANQSVVFGGEGETLRIRHEVRGREAFGPGILAGLSYAARAAGVSRGIQVAFEAV